ncbi:MAG: hypothetical protein R3C26_14885 [Calditrichia bacterium]
MEPAGRTEHSFDEVIDEFFARLDPVALGVAVGIVCGSGLCLLTVLTVLNGHSQIAPKLSLLGNYFGDSKPVGSARSSVCAKRASAAFCSAMQSPNCAIGRHPPLPDFCAIAPSFRKPGYSG